VNVTLFAVTFGGVVVDAGRSVREAFAMVIETFWALMLGFSLAGIVQASVSRATLQRQLGSHRPSALARATVFGFVSSSCSYAASAMARVLVRRGADFTAAMVFMVASTNLVIELGIVLWTLLGWQFLLAELIGGLIMVVLLGLIGGRVFPRAAVEDAADETVGHDHGEMHEDETEPAPPWTVRGLVDASSYAIGDLTMLRREFVLGFLAAGVLATVVPTGAYDAVFLHGHGIWTILENAVVGPIVAFVSCVCSVGNVPLAAALWHGGATFSGVVAFIFADLLALPLVLVYRRLYGGKLALRISLVLWLVISLAGLATEGIFRLLRIGFPARPLQIAGGAYHFGVIAALDIVAALVLLAAYLAYRARARLGSSAAYAIDPVCGMQVRRSEAPATAVRDGETFYFCSERCRDAFVQPATVPVQLGQRPAH
jgi:uncharacterized protein